MYSNQMLNCRRINLFSFYLGINSIRRSVVENKELPSPRKIGNAISRWDQKYEQNENVSYENNPNVFALMMGQIIAHDLGATVKKQISGRYLIFAFHSSTSF